MGTTLLDDVRQSSENAVEANKKVEAAFEELEDCRAALAKAMQERPAQKLAALAHLCSTEHPVSGKLYTISQAEDVLQLDAAYSVYKQRVSEMEAAVRSAEHQYQSALWARDYILASFKYLAGIR
jgi:hypothetical protein